MGFATVLTNDATEDITPPELKTFTFTPHQINTESGSATVMVTASGIDDLSGMSLFEVTFYSLSGGQSRGSYFGCSGLPCTGSAEVTFPQYSEAGIWNLSYVRIYDAIGNHRYYGTAELSAMGFATQLLITSEVVSELVPINGGATIDGKAGKRTSVNLWAHVQNVGPKPASNVQVSFELSADGLTFTKLGGPVRVGNLASGDMGIATTKCALPPGDYVIRATVDPGNRVVEHAEDNNVMRFPLTVR